MRASNKGPIIGIDCLPPLLLSFLNSLKILKPANPPNATLRMDIISTPEIAFLNSSTFFITEENMSLNILDITGANPLTSISFLNEENALDIEDITSRITDAAFEPNEDILENTELNIPPILGNPLEFFINDSIA